MTFVLDEASFSGDFAVHAGESLLNVLSYVPSTIRAINFQVGRWPEGCVTATESILDSGYITFWERLNEILSKLSHLQKIEFWFVILESESKLSWLESIEKRMSSSHAKDLVSFKYRYDLAPRWARTP